MRIAEYWLMLKFPNGCAAATAALNQPQAKTKTAAIQRCSIELASLALIFDAGSVGFSFQAIENFRRSFGKARMEKRVDRQRTPKKFLGLMLFAQVEIDYAGVEKQLSVFGSQPERLIDGAARRVELAVAKQVPSQDIVGVHISPIVELTSSQLKRFFRLEIVIGVKIGEFAVVELLVEFVQPADVLDQFVLAARLLALTDLFIDLTERRRIFRHRQNRHRLLIKFDRLGVAFLRRFYLSQARQGAIIIGIRLQRALIASFRLIEISDGELFSRELPFGPSDALRRLLGAFARADRALEIGYCAGAVAAHAF